MQLKALIAMYTSLMVSQGAIHGAGLALWTAGLTSPFSLVCLLLPSSGPLGRKCFTQGLQPHPALS